MDDFVLNVRQVGQYPRITATGPGDVLLVQQNGLGGNYASINAADLIANALLNGTALRLAADAIMQFNGATLRFQQGGFFFDKTVVAPALSINGNITAQSLTVGGSPVASQALLQQSLDAIVNNTVLSLNGRTGHVVLQLNDILRAGGAPIQSPHFGGWVTAPTPWNAEACDDTVATTSFVQKAICHTLESGHVVLSYNGRGGHVVPIADDITTALTVLGQWGLANTPPSGDVSKRIANTAFVDDALFELSLELRHDFTLIAEQLDEKFAPLDSPQFVGIPTAPTAAQSVNSGQLATTAFVHAAVTASTTGVSSWNGRTGSVTLTTTDVTDVGAALLVSPIFTGTPQAPTAAPGTNTQQLATTAFVEAAVGGVTGGVSSFNTRTGDVVLTTADVQAVGGAPIASPNFSGSPTAPTPAPGNNTTAIATTAFVANAISSLPAPVTSFNGRTGAITFQASDVSAVGGALLASPAFTGTPSGPTAIVGTNNSQLATTAFVAVAIAAITGGVSSFNARTGAVVLNGSDLTAAGGALVAGPTFTGVPSAPTATAGTNTTQLATTAFVQQALAGQSHVTAFNSRTGAVTLQASDLSAVGGALLSSPAFTGNPTAPTQAPGTNNTNLATTAFVMTALAAGGGVTSFNGRAGVVTLNSTDITNAGGAALASPAFTGNPTAPTQAAGDNDTSIASTAFVQAARTRVLLVDAVVAGSTSAMMPFTGANAGFDIYEIDVCLFAAAGTTPAPVARVSTDGGATYWSGATDYHTAWSIASSDASSSAGGVAMAWMQFGVGNPAAASLPHQANLRLMWPTATFIGMFRTILGKYGQFSGARISLMDSAGTLAATGAPWTNFLIQFSDGQVFQTNSRWKIWGCR